MVPSDFILIWIWQWQSKTDHPNNYINRFHTEITNLAENGCDYKDSHVKFEILEFCCDTPTLIFIKRVKPFRSYYSCVKSETQREYFFNGRGKDGRVTYPEVDTLLRTDESIRNCDLVEDYDGLSILENLAIDLIYSVSIDPMHLVYPC
jgi:hypothetical protein